MRRLEEWLVCRLRTGIVALYCGRRTNGHILVTSPSAVRIDDKRIFFTVGYGGGSMMLGLKEEGGKIVAEPIYELEKNRFCL